MNAEIGKALELAFITNFRIAADWAIRYGNLSSGPVGTEILLRRKMKTNTFWIGKDIVKAGLVVGLISTVSVFAQPTPIPTTPDAPCAGGPGADTVVSTMDTDGYLSLMDGTSFKGWWHSCQTGHSGGDPQGGIFKVSTAEKAFFLTQRGGNGGILMTNKKFDHYELVFDYWTDFNNDGGIFHRTPADGKCMQTVLDFIGTASLGGVWGEGNPPPISRDFRPFAFSGSVNNISIPGKVTNPPDEKNDWTTHTQKIKTLGASHSDFPCPTTGCTQTEWRALWDMAGWNQVRLQFYGGITGGANDPIKMKSWFRKVGAEKWIPVLYDTTIVLSGNRAYPANYIGLQIHGGGRFGGPKGAWYRNIKWRGLTDKGEYSWPTPSTSIDRPMFNQPGMGQIEIKATPRTLIGEADLDHEIMVSDLSGKVVDYFTGRAGSFSYAFKSDSRGLLLVQMKTARGVVNHRVLRAL